MLLVGGASGDLQMQALIVLVMLGVLTLVLICLLVAGEVMRLLGLTGVNVISRVAGIILAALAVQFMADGVLAFLAV